MGSALDSASLIMYPSGYSDGVLGSLKPTDGSGDFTFTCYSALLLNPQTQDLSGQRHLQ